MIRNKRLRTLAIATGAVAIVLLLLPGPVMSASSQCPPNFSTAYQTEPIILTIGGEQRELRRVYVSIAQLDLAGGRGVVQLDATTCASLDVFGEGSDCVPGIYAPERVTFVRLRMPDPAGRGRRVYAINGTSPEERLFLVVPALNCDAYRLTIEDQKGSVNRVLTLEQEPAPAPCPVVRRPRRCRLFRR